MTNTRTFISLFSLPLFIISLPSLVVAQDSVRQSIDGTTLPPAGEHRLNINVPGAGKALGALPEELGRSLYDLDKSPHVWEKLKATSIYPRSRSVTADGQFVPDFSWDRVTSGW